MPNVVKYSPGSTPTGCLKKGDFAIGNNTVDYGSSFYTGITPVTNGYTIYLNKPSNGPSIICPANDTQLIYWTKVLSGNTYATAAECLVWFAGQNDKVVVNKDYPGIVTNGLVLNLDASFIPSYPRTGTTWYDMNGINNGTLTNAPTFNSANGGSIVFDGVDDYINIPTSITMGSQNTVIAFIKLSASNTDSVVFCPEANGVDNWLGISSNRVFLYATEISDVNNFAIQGSTTLNTSGTVWYQIASTINNNVATIYLNGAQENTITQNFTIGSWTSVANIGRRGGFSMTRYFNGSIGLVQVYNRVLSPYEISKNYIACIGTNIVTDGLRLITSWTSLAGLTSRTENSVVAPDGSMSATLFERISIANTGHAQIRQSMPTIDLQPSTLYNVSFWAKRISLTQTIQFEFSDTPQQTITLTDDWKFYSFALTTGSTFPVGEFIDIGSTTVTGGSQLGEKYSIWSLHVSLA
jgi:hypothetical protein